MARARQVRRKRHRKSKGPNWGKIVGFSTLGLVIFLLVAATGIYFWVKSYLVSEEFRSMLEVRTGGAMKGDGRYADFQWTGSSAYTDSFEAAGYQDAWYSNAKAEGIRVDINFGNSLTRGVWEIEKVAIDKVSIDINEARLPGFHPGVPKPSDSFLASFVPKEFEVIDSKVDRFYLNVQGGREIRLDDIRLQAKPRDSGTLGLTGTNGTLVISDLPHFKVQNMDATIGDGELSIVDMGLTFFDKAVLSGRGEIKFRKGDEPSRVKINYRVRNLNLKDIVSEDWKQRMQGTVRGDFLASGRGDQMVHSGTLIVDGGVIEALPVLETFAKATKTNRFRRLVLDQAVMKYEFRNGVLSVERIDLASNNLLKIEGRAAVKDGVIDGDFYVGVTEDTLKWIPGALESVFTEERPEFAGYKWTTMKVQGPLDGPSENLSARLLKAAGIALVNAPLETIKSATGEGGILENAPDLIKGGVNSGTGVLESGVNTVKEFLPMFGP